MNKLHSPEPWTAMQVPAPSRTDHGWRSIAKCNEMWMVAAPRDAVILTENGRITEVKLDPEANARRIVACVNACAGIPDSILSDAAKDGVPVGQIEHLMMLIDKRRTAEQQRDELLAALKAIATSDPEESETNSCEWAEAEYFYKVRDFAAAVIAKAEGKGDE